MDNRLRLAPIWDGVVAYLRDHGQILFPIAAACFFLPTIIVARFMPVPTAAMGSISPSIVLPMAAMILAQTIGQLTIFVLMLNPGQPTVGQAFGIALRRLLAAIGVQLLLFTILCVLLVAALFLVMILMSAGVLRSGAGGQDSMRIVGLALTLTGPVMVYLFARLVVVYPALIGESLTPLEALRRGLQLTAGNGWKIVGLILIVVLLYFFIQLALGSAVVSVFILLGRLLEMEGLGSLLAIIFTAGLGAIANLIFTLGIGFLYRDLVR